MQRRPVGVGLGRRVAVLTGPSLFPDETDFRVLTGLPVERRVVFGAKLTALALFAGIFLIIAQVSVLPVFLLTAMGPLASPSWFVQVPAFLVAGALGSLGLVVVTVARLLLRPGEVPPGALPGVWEGDRPQLLRGRAERVQESTPP